MVIRSQLFLLSGYASAMLCPADSLIRFQLLYCLDMLIRFQLFYCPDTLNSAETVTGSTPIARSAKLTFSEIEPAHEHAMSYHATADWPCNLQSPVNVPAAQSPTQASTQTTRNMVDAQQHTIKALRRTNMRSEVRIDSDRDSACPLSSSPS